MTVGYGLIRESFTTEVILDKASRTIFVSYLDGPFAHLENRWRFEPVDADSSEIDFYIAYRFPLEAVRAHDRRPVRQGRAQIHRSLRGPRRRDLWRSNQ